MNTKRPHPQRKGLSWELVANLETGAVTQSAFLVANDTPRYEHISATLNVSVN